MKSSIVLSVLTLSAALAASARAAVVTGGDVVVLRVGDGSATLSSTSTSEYLDEYTRLGGAAVQSVNLSASTTARTSDSGSATSDGQITLNNNIIGVAGYDAPAGTASIASSASATVPRRVIGLNLASDLATSSPAVNFTSTTAYTGKNFRSVTTDGTNSFGAGSSTGTIDLTNGNTVQSAATNTRVVSAFNGNLYFTSGSAPYVGVSVLTGTPTTTGNTPTLLVADAAGSPYGFSVSPDGKTIYIADDAATGGVQKYTSADGASFSLAYTVATGGARGLAVDYSTAGGATIFATTAETNTRLISFVDNGTSASTLSTLATAPTNEAFRGVVVTPNAVTAPEPATLATLAGVGSLVVARRRRPR